ncbi:uncharacterized protein [Branchiostoma lanceolatum]|uniref:uncharacterized protein isoform X1 n=1 Tax=Branchiostoma lanceolatum TaxID=7740 RepID=UPI003453536D
MVQEFHVIRCFSCETFQVHQVKKSKKWNCKLCGAKQSVRKEYGRGTGADCRRHVQKLNMMRGTLDSAPPACEDSEEEWQESTEDATAAQYDYTDDGLQHSKWEKFVASSDLKPDDKDPSDSEDAQFTTDKNRFQQKKRKGKRQGERTQTYDRQGKRQRCQVTVPDVSARSSLVQTSFTDWQLPTTEQESCPMFEGERGYSKNTSHNVSYQGQNQGFTESYTEPQTTGNPAWQQLHTTSSCYIQQSHTTYVTHKSQHRDFKEDENVQSQTAAHSARQHFHTTNFTHSREALPDSLKRKVEESGEDKSIRNEESWDDVKAADNKKVDRRKRHLPRQGQQSLSSSSMPSSKWSKFTSKPVNIENDTDDDESVQVENFSIRQNDSSKLESLSTQYSAKEGDIGQHSRCLKGELGGCQGDDPAFQRYNQPMAKPPCDPQDGVNTRMTFDVQNSGEVSELRTAGFCTGEDLDDVLGEDIWDV